MKILAGTFLEGGKFLKRVLTLLAWMWFMIFKHSLKRFYYKFVCLHKILSHPVPMILKNRFSPCYWLSERLCPQITIKISRKKKHFIGVDCSRFDMW